MAVANNPYIRLGFPNHSLLQDTTVVPTHQPYTQHLNYDEYAIKGHMILASLVYTEAELMKLPKDVIKERLALMLATEMLEKGVISYTQGYDPLNGSNMIRARAFVVPSEDVQLLLVAKK